MTEQFIPGFPYGDPGDNWQIASDDFYQFVDEAFDSWYDSQRPKSNFGSAMPYDLTALEPESRAVQWRDDRTLSKHREWSRKVHPEVAAETERVRRPRERRGPGGFTREQWWPHAREVLLTDLALSEDQRVQVDAIIEAQLVARKRAEEIQAELVDARRQDDARRSAALRTELRANRAQLKDPYLRIEQIRRLLPEQQRPTFDMNRARLVAEQQEREKRKRRRARRARSGADAQAKPE